MLLSVIVLARDRQADTARCLDALRRHTSGPLEVLVYDNGSAPGAAAALRRRAASWPAMKLTRNARNVPFAAAVNAGMRAARGGLLCWLNNDAVVGPGWRAGLEAALRADPRAAAAGPLTGAMAPPEQIASRAGRGAAPARFLGGFCFMLRREALDAVGNLDERFVWGWEDMDYCLRLRQGGWRLLAAREVFVAHAGSATIRGLPPAFRRRTDLANRRLFLGKWALDEPWRSDVIELFSRTGAPWDNYRPVLSVIVPGDAGALRPCLRALDRAARGLSLEVIRPGPTLALVNAAVRQTLGDRILLLDPRGRLAPDALSRLWDTARREDAAAVGPASGLTHLAWQAGKGPLWRQRPRQVPYLRGGCLLVERKALARAGQLDERLLGPDAEADLCMRLRQGGGRVVLEPRAFLGGPARAPSGQAGPAARASSRIMFEKWGAP
ncbi:MAG: glycosyltransferase family 2 protein [Elusimicrobia bacterium]|nr:glycosyltransferase family 2 protein [Elusimicrobiota bacterium]